MPGHRPSCQALLCHFLGQQLPNRQTPEWQPWKLSRQCCRAASRCTAPSPRHRASAAPHPRDPSATGTGSSRNLQQGEEQTAKSASQHGAGKPKQSLAATPSHRLPAAPASTSHLQGLSSQSCYLQPSQYPTRPKFSLFSTYVPRNKVSTGNAKDNRSTCLETEWMERELHTDPSKARPGQDKGSMPEQLFTAGWCS